MNLIHKNTYLYKSIFQIRNNSSDSEACFITTITVSMPLNDNLLLHSSSRVKVTKSLNDSTDISL